MAAAVNGRALLERGAALAMLGEGLEGATRGHGRLLLVSGEAGVGKTALVRAFRAEAAQTAAVLEGACEPLFTPRPLAPFADIAEATGGELARLVADGAPAHDLIGALLAELRARVSVVVLEDVHWADEASLDVLRLLGRRVADSRALVVATFRDDELDPAHPLRLVLGGLSSTDTVRRLRLEPLSAEAVGELAARAGVDGAELYDRTAGNPFFVTEVLAAGANVLPATVRDAVLARAARLGPDARLLLDAAAVVPNQVELSLLDEIAGELIGALDECVAGGMLVERPGAVAFRHELARIAVEDALSPLRRRELHRRIVAALAAREPPDHARLAHHAEAAGDSDAVLEFALPAAERAAELHAHREAAGQFGRALRAAEGRDDAVVSRLLVGRARECELTGEVGEALAARQAARAAFHRLGDPLKEGEQLSAIGRLAWLAGDGEASAAADAEAIEILERLPPSLELARAYGAMCRQRAVALDAEGARAWGARAIELAERFGDERTVLAVAHRVGFLEALGGSGDETLRRALEAALEADFDDLVSSAYTGLAIAAIRRRDWPSAQSFLEEGIRYTTERDLEADRLYVLGWRAAFALAQSRWEAAASDATEVLRAAPAPMVRATPLMVIGLLRARRGDPGVWEALDEASSIARSANELPKLAPGAVGRAEAAFLDGDLEKAAAELEPFQPAALADRWVAGELAVWRRRVGLPVADPGPIPDPCALELAGDYTGASEAWRSLDCPYEAALTLAMGDDERALRRAHDDLLAIGARPAGAFAARRLRDRGVTGLTRGPRRTTLANPAGLTTRELDVVELLSAGLRNAEIARQLHLSTRTVDHHVSSILRKLQARTRSEAVAAAGRLGLARNGPS